MSAGTPFWPSQARREFLTHHDIVSSVVLDVWYDSECLELYLLFFRGWYRYDGVPNSLVKSFLSSQSKGQFFNQFIQPFFPATKGPEEEWSFSFSNINYKRESLRDPDLAIPAMMAVSKMDADIILSGWSNYGATYVRTNAKPFFFYSKPEWFQQLPPVAKIIKMVTTSMFGLGDCSDLSSENDSSNEYSDATKRLLSRVGLSHNGTTLSVFLKIGFMFSIHLPSPVCQKQFSASDIVRLAQTGTIATPSHPFMREEGSTINEHYLKDFGCYDFFPREFHSYIKRLILETNTVLAISILKPKSKELGHCKRMGPGVFEIVVRIQDDPYERFLVLLHEFAHALRPQLPKEKPHDQYWKLAFSNLLINAYPLFPPRYRKRIQTMIASPYYHS